MGELIDAWKTEGRMNTYGAPVEVRQMQSEAGAAGAMHGALVAGSGATSLYKGGDRRSAGCCWSRI